MPVVEGVRHRYVTVHQGTDTSVRLHVAEFGEGVPVLLLHGYLQHWYVWRQVLPLLPSGYRVLCVDLRGFGWSERARAGYDLGTLAHDISGLIAELELGPALVAGHDLGAQVALRLAMDRPADCAGVLAIGAHHPFATRRRIAANFWRMWFTALFEYPVLGPRVIRACPQLVRKLLLLSARDRGAWQESDLREFVEATQASACPAQQVLWQYVLKELPRMLRRYGGQRLAVPTILLAGDHDVVVPPSLLDGDSSRVGRLEARLVPGCGHQLPVEAPTQVVAALGSFDSVC
jgi:pimeloyl-ACP methyl ester carboxylesterase